MSTENKAVFLSYASQDAEAAKKICDALRQAGVEVWFDQSELRGGDAWDQKIRKQIKECALLIPIISAATQARTEGYFRLEWRLADQRTHLMGRNKTFLLPVTIDGTTDTDADVPDSFTAVQWTKAPNGEVPLAFCTRVTNLLDVGAPLDDAHISVKTGRPRPEMPRGEGTPPPIARSPRWLKPVLLVLAAVVLIVLTITLIRRPNRLSPEPAATVPEAAKLSLARELVTRARAVLGGGSLTRNQLAAAGELCARALQLDSTDPIVWATAAKVDLTWIYPYGYDVSLERRHRAEEEAAHATALGPDLFDVRVVQARVLAHAVATPAVLGEAEKTFRDLHATHPDDRELASDLGEVLRQEERYPEAAKLFEQIGEFEVAGWSYFLAGDGRAALSAVERSPRTVTSVMLKAMLQVRYEEDPDQAQATIDQLRPSELLAQMPAATAIDIAMYRRDWHRMLDLAQGLSEEYLDSNAFRGPRRFFTGLAYEMAGRPALAEPEWRAALAVIQTRLTAAPDDRQLLLWAAWLHAALNETADADRLFARSQAIAGLNGDAIDFLNLRASLRLRHKDAVLTWAETMLRTKARRWEVLHSDMRYSPEWDWLRGDPRFEKLVRDYLPEGAKPFHGPKPADDRVK